MVVQFFKPEFRLVVGVNEEVRLCLKERDAILEKSKVGGGNQIEPTRRAVRIQSGDAPAVHPEVEVVLTVPGLEHHLIMVAEDRHEMAATG
jgi:hypothetical protein